MSVDIQGYCAWLFSFMDWYSWAHKEIVLASLFYLQIDLCGNTRRSCLSFFYSWVNIRSTTFLSDRSLLEHMTDLSALLQRFGWDYQSCCFIVPLRYLCTVITLSCRWWSLCLTYTQNLSRVFFLLNFGLASLPFLLNNGSYKPIKYWCSLYVVKRTWDKLKSV